MLPLGLASRGDMVVVVVGIVNIIVGAFVFALFVGWLMMFFVDLCMGVFVDVGRWELGVGRQWRFFV